MRDVSFTLEAVNFAFTTSAKLSFFGPSPPKREAHPPDDAFAGVVPAPFPGPNEARCVREKTLKREREREREGGRRGKGQCPLQHTSNVHGIGRTAWQELGA